MAKEGWGAQSREHSLLGLGIWLAGVGKDNPHSTGDAEISLGHTVQIPFMPLLPKETITNDGIGGHWGTAPSIQKGQPWLGGR